MLRRTLQRLVFDDDGMEMIEWSVVGVVFAVGAAFYWTAIAPNVDAALDVIALVLDPGQGDGTGTGDGVGNGVGGDPDDGKSTCC
jgi:Flp pilus assembly pilin Flp